MIRISTFSVCSTVVLVLFASDLLAQSALDEVVVTATRRAANIQDVPVSVSAIGAEQIEKLGIVDMEDLSLYVPNFEINSSSIIPNLYIRGIGGGTSHSIEQSVGRFIDDVYIGRAAINLHGFMDLANVEVLRGPQGTLFGKNTAGGALIVRTGSPTANFESGLSLSVGNYSTVGGNSELQGFVSGPLSENVSARVAIRWRDRDGYYENRLNGPDGSDRTDYGIRAKFRWDVSDNTVVDLKLEHQEYDEFGADAAEFRAVPPAPGLLAGILAASPGFVPGLDWVIDVDCGDVIANRDTTGDGMADTAVNTGSFCPQRDQESENVTLKIEHELDAGTITSISAYQSYDYDHQFNGLDMGAAGAFRATRIESYSGFSQELRFTSTESEHFDYIAGIYFEDSDINRQQSSEINLVTVFQSPSRPFLGRDEPWTQDTQTIAGFAQLRWQFDNNLALVLGGRYASEDKDFDFLRRFEAYNTDTVLPIPGGPGGPPLNVSASRSENKFTGSASLQWHASDDVMAYASFAQGHKTGGFSDRIPNPAADFEFDEEDIDSLELGLKSLLLNGAMSLNLAVYHMEVSGLQLSANVQSGPIPEFTVTNAADTTIDGIELDVSWAITDLLTIGGNYAFTDASYDSFPGSSNCPAGVVPAADGTCDLAGFPLIFAPENGLGAFVDVFADNAFGEWDLNVHADVSYTDETFTDITYSPVVLSDDHTIYNASIALISPSDKYTVSLLGKNLSEEKYCAWCQASGLSNMNPPREISLRFRARFD